MKRQQSNLIPTILMLLFVLGACSVPPKPTLAEIEDKQLSFLEIGKTTRADVLTQLGTPSGSFENERILTYRLRLDPKNGLVNYYPWQQYGLTVVFARDGRLENYKLLEH